MKMLILGVSGMLGHTLMKYFIGNTSYNVLGTIRNRSSLPKEFWNKYEKNLIESVDVFDFDNLKKIVFTEKPSVILNAIGIIKQKKKKQRI